MKAQSTDQPDDALLANVIAQRKAIFLEKYQHLPITEREEMWKQTFAQIASMSTLAASMQPSYSESGVGFSERSTSQPQQLPSKRRRISDGTALKTTNIQPHSETSQTMCGSASSTLHGARRQWKAHDGHSSTSTVCNWIDESDPLFGKHQVGSSNTGSVPRCRRASKTINVSSFDPSDWIKNNNLASPSPFSSGHHSRTQSNTPVSPYQKAPSFLSSSPYSDRNASPIEAHTAATSLPMSRGTSQTSSWCRGMDNLQLTHSMSRGNSSASHSFQNVPGDAEQAPLICDEPAFISATFDSRQCLSHTGGAAPDSFEKPTTLALIDEVDSNMERSFSAESSSSTTSRFSRRSREQAASSTRAIAPIISIPAPSMAGSLEVNPSAPTSHGMSRTQSSENQSERVPIPKLPDNRPVREKLKCDKCDKRPQGYKGEHELRRHQASQHGDRKTVWVCIDISEDHQFLSNCHHCRDGKQYGAYYNAAAHLRRKHFNPRPKGEKRSGKLSDDEKRGGKGGGLEPPMEELKRWMKDIEVNFKGQPLNADDEKYAPMAGQLTTSLEQPQPGDEDCPLDIEEMAFDVVPVNAPQGLPASPTNSMGSLTSATYSPISAPYTSTVEPKADVDYTSPIAPMPPAFTTTLNSPSLQALATGTTRPSNRSSLPSFDLNVFNDTNSVFDDQYFPLDGLL